MRKHFNSTIDQISSLLNGSQTGSHEHRELLDELKFRSSKRAKTLLEQYELSKTTELVTEEAPRLVDEKIVPNKNPAYRLSQTVESLDILLSDYASNYDILIRLLDEYSATVQAFGINSLADEETLIAKLGWNIQQNDLSQHDFLIKKLTQRRILLSFLAWAVEEKMAISSPGNAQENVLATKNSEKLTTNEKEIVSTYINRKLAEDSNSITKPSHVIVNQTTGTKQVRYLPRYVPRNKNIPFQESLEKCRDEEAIKRWILDEPKRRRDYDRLWDDLQEINRIEDMYRAKFKDLSTVELNMRWRRKDWKNDIEMNMLRVTLRSKSLK